MPRQNRVAIAVVMGLLLTSLIVVEAAENNATGRDFLTIALGGLVSTSFWVFAMWRARPPQ